MLGSFLSIKKEDISKIAELHSNLQLEKGSLLG